ncbi:hypothetical protein BC834DRAFT_883718 [Gloeopeniophorella convolvens]|nr:hypothetical protein BC834DRAFT_883718 [Gloeopeniophorella convolvens]
MLRKPLIYSAVLFQTGAMAAPQNSLQLRVQLQGGECSEAARGYGRGIPCCLLTGTGSTERKMNTEDGRRDSLAQTSQQASLTSQIRNSLLGLRRMNA